MQAGGPTGSSPARLQPRAPSGWGPASGGRGLQCSAGRVRADVRGESATSHAPGGRGRGLAGRVRAVVRGESATSHAPGGRGVAEGEVPAAARAVPPPESPAGGCSRPGRSGSSEATLLWGPRRPSTSPGRVAGPRRGPEQLPSGRRLLRGAAQEGAEAAVQPLPSPQVRRRRERSGPGGSSAGANGLGRGTGPRPLGVRGLRGGQASSRGRSRCSVPSSPLRVPAASAGLGRAARPSGSRGR